TEEVFWGEFPYKEMILRRPPRKKEIFSLENI
ncbi:unnamed protein product, partial [marine sediment metagenome]